MRYIAQNKQLNNLADELQYFFEDFLTAYKEECESKEWGYANQFLIIIQNQRLIDDIIINPFVIQKIINIYQKDTRKHFTFDEQKFLQKIFFSSFSDDNSYLASELGGGFNIDPRSNNGILLAKIIEDLSFLEKLHIVGDGRAYQYDKNITFARNYLNFTARVHEEFRNKERITKNHKFHQLLFDTFKTQANIIWKNFKSLDYIQLRSLPGSNFEYDLGELEDSLLEIYGGTFPEIFLNPKAPYGGEYHYHDSNKSLLDAYAFGIFELFEAFSWHYEEDTRDYTIDFSFLRSEGLILKELEKRIIVLFKQTIPENLDGHSARVSRIFWDNYSWDILNTTESVNKNYALLEIIFMYAEKLPRLAKGFIYTYTEDALKDQYKKEKALEKSRKIIADLFPKNIDYDTKNNLLNIYDYDRLSFQSIDLGKTLSSRKIVTMA